MTALRLKHVDRFVDRHGHVRHYFRRNRGPRILLPGEPGSSDFMAAYQAALTSAQAPATPKRRGSPGTFDDLLQTYFESAGFARLARSSQEAYRLTAEKLVREEGIGHRLVAQLQRKHVDRMIGKRASRPGAANNTLTVLRILVRYAVELGWRTDDPTARIRRFTGGEHHTWSDQEIATFEARWPIGTRERTAFALLLHTGQRSSDVRTMTWNHIEGPGINVVQQKTKTRLWVYPSTPSWLPSWPNGRAHMSQSSRPTWGRHSAGIGCSTG